MVLSYKDKTCNHVCERGSVISQLRAGRGSLSIALCSHTSYVPPKDFCRQCAAPLTSKHDFYNFPVVGWGPGGTTENPSHIGGPDWSSVPSSVAREQEMAAFLPH